MEYWHIFISGLRLHVIFLLQTNKKNSSWTNVLRSKFTDSQIHWLFPHHTIVFLHPYPCVCLCVCLSVFCTRLPGVSTPQTSPEQTWVPHGFSIKVFSLLKGMYQCSELMEGGLHEPVFTNLFLFFLLFFSFQPLLFSWPCVFLLYFRFPPFFPGFVYSARSVCGVAMRPMRTRFPLLPGSLISV